MSTATVALVVSLADVEKQRRRDRTEQGRSPVQRTSRSRNKARAHKRPGKGQRNQWRHEAH